MKPLKKLYDEIIDNEIVQKPTDQHAVQHSPNKMPMIQNISLVWLDTNIDENNADCRHTITQLRHFINSINTFTDENVCVEFLQRMDNEKICLIISGLLGKDIVPRIHNMFQVDAIFIFCNDKTYHDEWTKDWSKIKGVFTEITHICNALTLITQQCEQNAMSISFVDTSGDISKKKLNQLDPSFMYTQIIKEILLSIEFGEKHLSDFIEYCSSIFEDNDKELRNVSKLESQYHAKTPIWWYTYECFLYPMVNRALRVLDSDIIIRLGFFIDDLHQHIDQLHKEQFGDSDSADILTLYRGQGLSKDAFKKMSETKGGLLAFNCFLSTSKTRTVSLRFANGALRNPDSIGVLFVMTVDPRTSKTPFASIRDVSYFRGEDEILFSMHTIFRIDEITSMDEDERLYQVNLTLTSDDDKDLRLLTERIREETYPDSSGWYRLGMVLLKMGLPAKAEDIYRILLENTTEAKQKEPIYHQLGWTKSVQAQYKEAVIYYEKSLELKQRFRSSNHPDLAATYNNLGLTYSNLGEYSKSLSCFLKALKLQQQTLPPNHTDLATSNNNIGLVYFNMGNYSEALSFYVKTLEILQQTLPPNHPNLATAYNNIGLVYISMGQYPKALSFQEKALEIQQQSLPSNHPDLALSYMNIAIAYSNMCEYSKAVSYFEKSLEIRQQTLPSNHPDLAVSYNNIGMVYEDMGNYTEACSYYERAIETGKKSLPTNHPYLEQWKNNLDLVKNKL